MFKQFKPEQTFINSIDDTVTLRRVIEQTHCPGCGQSTLKLGTYTRTPKEWGATVSCSNCSLTGEVNNTGFNFNKVDGKGRAIK